MNTRASKLSPNRVAFFVLLCLGALIPLGCSSTGRGGWGDSQTVDLSKIFVYAVTPSPNLQLPVGHGNAPQALTQALQQQLAEANRLQTDESAHSLSFYGVILSYQDGVIDAQGELYDDEEYLVYSRVKRRLDLSENWDQGLNLVAEQMLDELMHKLREGGRTLPPPCQAGDYRCGTTTWVQPPIYYDNNCWGCWRYYDNYGYDHDHDDHDKPKPKPHWVPGAIIESEPRSSFTHEIKVHAPRGGERSTGRSESGGGYGGSSSTSGSTTTESRTDESKTDESRTRPTRTISEPRGRHESRGEHSPETRSERSIETPRTREVERPQSAPSVHESPSSSETSLPQSAPVVRESAPAPRVEAPVRSAPVETLRSETHSSPPVMHESPRSHESSSGNSGSSNSSSSGSSSGGGHGGGHGGHRGN